MSDQRSRKIGAFLTIAEEEFAAARQLAPLLPRQGAYFLQQSIEKLVRAVLECDDIAAGATHNLRYLADLLGQGHPLQAEFIAFDDLTPASTRYRYPSPSGALAPVKAESVMARFAEVESLTRHVRNYIDGKKIINGLSLTVNDGEIAAIMGPNGSGKSTLSYVISGREGYEVTDGEILLNGANVLDMDASERAAKGVFLAFQYPLEIPGVTTMTFLKACMNAQRKARGEAEFTTPEFIKRVRAGAEKLGVPQDMLRRALNVGFSGGEKKRMEVLQMSLLEPSFAILDETDSGLDIDALRVVADGVNALRDPKRSFLVITHYQRLLDYIVPDTVHVMSKGRIVKTGGKELAHELEANGYRDFVGEAA
jgi:Fe-S cluster assembly ATP-binding protein